MDEFDTVVLMNKATLELKKREGENYLDNINIDEVLQDRDYFKKADKTKALVLLKRAGVKDEKVEETYENLINERQ